MEQLHLFLCFFLILSGFFVGFSSTPINSVLSLILTFCNAACILLIFNVEFIGLTFIIVYVGAIAVLFLFVIMMLDVKIQHKLSSNSLFKEFLLVFLLLLVLVGSYFVFELFKYNNYNVSFSFLSIEFLSDNLNNIDILGQVLYNYYLVCVLISGLILLVALVGAIVLTLRFNLIEKHQLSFRQLSRTDSFISFFK